MRGLPGIPHGRRALLGATTALVVLAGSVSSALGTGGSAPVTAPAVFATPVSAALPNDALADPNASMDGIDCVSPQNCVAVGRYNRGQAVAVSEVAGNWAAPIKVSLPTGWTSGDSASGLHAVECSALTACVAVGQFDDASHHQQALLAQLVGTHWSTAVVALPSGAASGNPLASLNAIDCPSSTSCVAVGQYTDSSGAQQAMELPISSGVAGTAVQIALPSGASSFTPTASLVSLSCPAVGNCTSVGTVVDTNGKNRAMAVSESSGLWSTAVIISPPSGASPGANAPTSLNAVSCISSGNCVAGGTYVDGANENQVFVVAQSSGVWGSARLLASSSKASTSNPQGSIDALSCTGAGACVAVGTFANPIGRVLPMGFIQTNGTWGSSVDLSLPGSTSFGNPATVIGALDCSTTGECALAGSFKESSSTRGFVGASVAKLGLTIPLPSGAVASSYRQQTAAATGGTGLVSYQLLAGSVPDGLSLNENTGQLTGVPTSTGASTFAIVVSDLGDPPQTTSATFSLTIGKGTPALKVVSLTPNPKSGQLMGLKFTGLVVGSALTVTVKGSTGPPAATFQIPNVGDIQTLNFSLVTRDRKLFKPGVYTVTATTTGTSNFAAGVLAPFTFVVH